MIILVNRRRPAWSASSTQVSSNLLLLLLLLLYHYQQIGGDLRGVRLPRADGGRQRPERPQPEARKSICERLDICIYIYIYIYTQKLTDIYRDTQKHIETYRQKVGVGVRAWAAYLKRCGFGHGAKLRSPRASPGHPRVARFKFCLVSYVKQPIITYIFMSSSLVKQPIYIYIYIYTFITYL